MYRITICNVTYAVMFTQILIERITTNVSKLSDLSKQLSEELVVSPLLLHERNLFRNVKSVD
jgi:hypothetical protein